MIFLTKYCDKRLYYDKILFMDILNDFLHHLFQPVLIGALIGTCIAAWIKENEKIIAEGGILKYTWKHKKRLSLYVVYYYVLTYIMFKVFNYLF